jgi:Leucine-rich repeat (LRR) protein
MLQPLISDYKQAVLDATNSFKDLLPIEAVLVNGEPKFATGNFAVVFQMRKTDSNKLMAVKCFHRHLSDRQVRQQHIAAYLEKNKPKYFVPYRYLPEELWIDTGNHAQDYAVVAMDWVEGKTLGETVKNYCKAQNKEALSQLADKFCEMASYLLTLPIAHGDLKHDNILVTPAGELVLVDYDGMYVPALQGHEAAELGGTDYQHPQRKGTDYNATIDDYSIAIIALSLAALAQQPELYELQKGENLLLSRQDILNPFASEILPKIEDIDNKTVQKLLNLVKNAVMGQSIEVKGLKEVLERILDEYCPLTMEWWDGLLQYGNLKQYDLEQYTWQDIFRVHLFFWEKGIVLNEDVVLKNKYEWGNCFKIYQKEFNNIFGTTLTKITQQELNKIYQINSLWLYECGIDTLTPLRELKILQELNFNDNEISITQQELNKLSQINSLYEGGIDTLTLQELKNLQKLNFNGNQISSLEPLQELKNLQKLNCGYNQISSLEPLRELKNLQELCCHSNQVSSLEPLRELKNLQELRCWNNQISSLEPLRELKNLQELYCDENQISSVEPLRDLKNLRSLYCSYNKISSLVPLRDLKNLEELRCYGNQINSSEIEKFKMEHPNCKVDY